MAATASIGMYSMDKLMICLKDSKAVIFEGAGTYFFVTALGIYIKAKCMEVIELEVKHNRPLIHMDEASVKAFDFCGGAA